MRAIAAHLGSIQLLERNGHAHAADLRSRGRSRRNGGHQSLEDANERATRQMRRHVLLERKARPTSSMALTDLPTDFEFRPYVCGPKESLRHRLSKAGCPAHRRIIEV